MSERTLRKYWKFFCDIWRMFKKHRNVQTDDEWEVFVNEATMLRQRYPGEFSRQIIMAVLNEVERRSKHEEQEKPG